MEVSECAGGRPARSRAAAPAIPFHRRLQISGRGHRIQSVPFLRRILAPAFVVAAAAMLLAAAEQRTVAPTFLYRRVPDLPEKKADLTTPSCHYKPIFGAGDSRCTLVNYPREEQVYIVMSGSPVLHYGETRRPLRRHDYLYLPPGVRHGLSNPSRRPARVLVMGWHIPKGMKVQPSPKLMLANIDEVPLQAVGRHPSSSRFRLLMGTTESKRDHLAAAHVLTSLFIIEFAPGGTNFPHHHEREEEFYYLMSGKGDMVAGGGLDGVEGRHPATAGDVLLPAELHGWFLCLPESGRWNGPHSGGPLAVPAAPALTAGLDCKQKGRTMSTKNDRP